MEFPLKVVLDTNILISALITPGKAREFIHTLIQENIKFAISDYIVAEVNEVLLRKKLRRQQIAVKIWDLIQKDITIVKVKPLISKIVVRDPKDHPILQTALKSKAKFIITGDDDLLSLKSWKKLKIVNMKDFEKLI